MDSSILEFYTNNDKNSIFVGITTKIATKTEFLWGFGPEKLAELIGQNLDKMRFHI